MKTNAVLVSLLFWITLFTGAALASAGELGGTSWRVTAINNGKQAVQSLIAYTEITADFKTDGTIAGSAGCNRYTAAYAVSGKEIKIERAASTRMICMEPPGIMEQEKLYLDMLESVRSYHMSAGQLRLLKADGSAAVIMVAANIENKRFLFSAEATEVLVETMPNGKMIMTYRGDEYVLQQVKNKQGIMYADASDKTTTFLARGDRALATIKGKTLPALTMVSSSYSYGLIRPKKEVYRSDAIEAIIERVNGSRVFMTVNGEIFLMKLTPSADGQRYEADGVSGTILWLCGNEAALTLKGKTYPRSILKPLYGPDEITQNVETNSQALIGEWRVESFAGNGVLPGTMITMEFCEDGRLFGKATINNYFAMWLVADNAIMLTRAGSTMMAGPEEQMWQEQSFLDMLRKVGRYDIHENKLVMTAADGTEIVSAKIK